MRTSARKAQPDPAGARTPRPDPAPREPVDAFTALYREQYRDAVRLAYALVGPDRCEDVVQEAFARLAPHHATLTDPRAYLRRTVVNLARETHRRRSRERARLALVAETPRNVPLDARELLDVLGRLPYRYRAVLVLRYWADWSEAEIASALHCRRGTVKSRASRGLALLRKDLEG